MDDYAFYIASLIEIYNSTLDDSYLEKAEAFCGEAVRCFLDDENGGYYLCEINTNEHFVNPKETYDGAISSGNSVMVYNFVRLYQLTDKEKYKELADKQIEFMSYEAQGYPSGYSMFLLSKLIYENPPEHIVIVLKDMSDLPGIYGKLPLLANVLIVSESKEYQLINDKITYYVCINHNCLPPANTI